MIEKIRLDNFRTFETAEFSFSPLTVIIGNNGTGKTSILEAISMLSLTTSWRAEKDTEVIEWNKPFARVVSGDMDLVVQHSPYLKRIRIGGVSKRVQQVIGYFPTILFQPDDMFLLYGAPAYRRHYLDRVISQTSPVYTQAVLQVAKVIKQRNRLLKNIGEGTSGRGELDFWDVQLEELHEVIQKQREEFLAAMQELVPPLFAGMVSGGGEVSLHYHRSPHASEHTFLEHLAQNREKEIAAGSSLYGPHREDVGFLWGSHPVEESLSRGQARSLLVAFKVAELHYLREKNERRPVLLLDDIFSELDKERRERLLQAFGEYQVIMTTTELGPIEKLLKGESQVIELKEKEEGPRK